MDPNHMHEFNPNRQGFCKSIISGRICGLPEEWTAHVRFREKQAERDLPPFENFNVYSSFESSDTFQVCVAGRSMSQDDVRQFVEDAIREKCL